MGWDLATIRAKLKDITGRHDLQDSELDFWINAFYRDELPVLVGPSRLRGLFAINLISGVYKYHVPSDIRAVFPPFVLGSTHLTLHKDPATFFVLYPDIEGGDPSGEPEAVLYTGHQMFFAPVPDGKYRIITQALYKPDALSATTDTPIVEAWGEGISYGAAAKIYSVSGDYDSAKAMFTLAKQSLLEIRRDDLYDYAGVRAFPRF